MHELRFSTINEDKDCPGMYRGAFEMTKENFWRELPRPFFILAPMEDVTDVVFRHVVSEAGRPDVFLRSLRIQRVIVTRRGTIVCAGG